MELEVDGHAISMSFSVEKNTRVVERVKQILLSDYVSNQKKPDILADTVKICDTAVRESPDAP